MTKFRKKSEPNTVSTNVPHVSLNVYIPYVLLISVLHLKLSNYKYSPAILSVSHTLTLISLV